MLDQIVMSQGKLYSRAVDPAVEGRLRANAQRQLTPLSHNDVQASPSREQQARQQYSQYRDSVQGHTEPRSKEVADQLSQALRQAKQGPVRQRGQFSLVTTTGRQANQSYLTGGQAREARIVDELA